VQSNYAQVMQARATTTFVVPPQQHVRHIKANVIKSLITPFATERLADLMNVAKNVQEIDISSMQNG